MRRERKGRRFRPDQPQNASLQTSVFPKLFTAQHLPAPFNIKCYKDDFAFPSLSAGPRQGTVPRADQRGRGEGKKIRFTPCQDFGSDLTSFAERNQKKPPFGVKALISHPLPPRTVAGQGGGGSGAVPLTAPLPRCVGGAAPRRATLCCCTLHSHSTTLSFNLNIPKLAN